MSDERAAPEPGQPPEAESRSAARPPAARAKPAATRIDVPWSVFAKAVVATLLTLGLLEFFREAVAVLVLITLALFLTAVLNPLTGWLERHGLGRGLASLASVAVAVLAVLALLALIVPPIVVQGIEFAEDLPDQLLRLRRWLARYPAVFDALEQRALAIRQDPAEFFSGFLRFGAGAVTTIVSAVLILTLALYFLIDGERIRRSVLEHVPPAYRDRLDRTIREIGHVVRAYFTGQAIVSFIFAALTFTLLTVLGVPYATVLAALAFFFDAIPNIGATLATVVPALLAFATEGLTDAIIIVVVVMVYQQIENNLIAPRVIGGKLEIPPVLTLIAILIGGQLLGVIGIIIAIPLAGTFPVIDRIWITGEPAAPADRAAAPAERAAD